MHFGSKIDDGRMDGTMLILTRVIGESLIIGDDIVVTVLGIRDSQIRLGISAPKHISVHREEIYKRIERERRPMRDELDRLPEPSSSAVLSAPSARDVTQIPVTSRGRRPPSK